MLHQIIEPTPWRGRCFLVKKNPLEEDAEREARVRFKFKEWLAHWQVGLKVHEADKPWESMEL